jgi:hypothetical protein
VHDDDSDPSELQHFRSQQEEKPNFLKLIYFLSFCLLLCSAHFNEQSSFIFANRLLLWFHLRSFTLAMGDEHQGED